MEIKGKWQRTLFLKDNFSIALYKASKPFRFPNSEKDELYFKAKGFDIPLKRNVIYNFSGEWEVSPSAKGKKNEYLFHISECHDAIPTDDEGIIRYLKTLDGIGPKGAKKLFAAYGKKIFDVLDNDINRIFDEKIIREASFKRLKLCWLKKDRRESELFIYLGKFGVSDNVIMRIYDKYQEFALDLIKEEPYSFTDIYGFGFYTADAIAKDNSDKLNDEWRNDTPRIKAAILEVLKGYENGSSFINSYNKTYGTNYQAGNTCIEWADLYKLTKGLLDTDISDIRLFKILNSMKEKQVMIDDRNYIFRYETWLREAGVAKSVTRLLKSPGTSYDLSIDDVTELLNSAIKDGVLNCKLSDEQLNAVATALNNNFCIITGGPGTGKTMIQKMIIYAAMRMNPHIDITLAAPTGRAARRMSESTGYPAQTLHSLLGLTGDDTYTGSISEITCDMLIVDESSMVDISLANYLFSAVSSRTRVIFVGDDQQLPSVGPGSVLRELIASNCIPVAALTQVFRQAKGSSIGYNAKRIIAGTERMIEDESFQFIDVIGTKNIVEKVKEIYLESLKQYDVSNLCVLSPFRRFNSLKEHTYSGVENLNSELQKLIFGFDEPPKGIFQVNDKVMYTKNDNGLANGDVGLVTAVNNYEGALVVSCNFEGIEIDLEGEALNNLELAYATTVHKSQGSEYPCVLFVIDSKHSVLLKRNIIYTAVTRAKQKIIIIGEIDAFLKAIHLEETESRLSRLAVFIQRNTAANTLIKKASDFTSDEQLSLF